MKKSNLQKSELSAFTKGQYVNVDKQGDVNFTCLKCKDKNLRKWTCKLMTLFLKESELEIPY